jgi:hypothetical protein
MAISSALGNALVPTSYGFRNVIINGNFMINQRAYASGTNLASGAYGFDRWKSNFTNTALTFTSAPQGQTVTISASGVVRQIVEQANVVAGSYVLSWFGTATGRVYNDGATPPSYQSGPLSVVLDGTANVIVEFTPASGTATLGNVQLEFGSRATPFEHRPIGVELALCQRYYYSRSYSTGNQIGIAQAYTTQNCAGLWIHITNNFRVAPTLVSYPAATAINIWNSGASSAAGQTSGSYLPSSEGHGIYWDIARSGSGLVVGNAVALSANTNITFGLNAEL